MRATILLTSLNYKSKRFKRFIITDIHSSKEHRISIPTMYGRVMQVFYLMLLESISETTANLKSFDFSKCKYALDAHSCIMELLKKQIAPKCFLVCNVKSCYDSISYQWLLNNIPIDKHVLK